MKFQSLLFTMLVAVLSFAQSVPTITSLDTYSAKVGATVVITGTNFNTTAANNAVFFSGVKANVTSASATSLSVTVPKANSSCIVKVINTGTNLGSNEKPFVIKHTNTGSLVFGFATNNFGTQGNVASTLKSGTYGAGLNWKIADINNDGLGDFIFIKNDNTITIYLNPGANSSFSLSGVTPLSISPSTAGNISDLDVADFNNDGKMDVVISQNMLNNGNGAAEIFKNNGDNTFASYATINFSNLNYFAGWNAGSTQTLRICAGDVDNDGKVDLFASSQTMYTAKPFVIYRQTAIGSTGTFTSYFLPNSSGNYYPVTQAGLADFNNDGFLDAYYGIDPIRYYLGSASGFTGTEQTIAFNAGYSMNKAVRTDLNNDGNFDNLFSNASSVANLNFVSGSMAATAVTTEIKEYADVIDQDNDGDIDLVSAAGWWGGNGIRGSEKGASSFSAQISFSAFDDVRMGQSYLIDLNGDGYLDVIAPYLDGSKIVYSFFVGNPVPPTITANPSNSTQSYCVGSTATALSITATGATSYKWQSSPNNSTWTDISGATSATYTPSTASASALYYRGVAINSFGSTNSTATGLITVNALPTLTTNPTTTLAQYCYNYNSTTAITVATSASSPTYQWQVSSNNSTFTDVTSTNGSGGTTASFVPSHVDIWYGGTKYYRCIVTSNSCSTTSNSKPFGIYAGLTEVTIPSTANENYCINSTPNNLTMVYSGDNNLTYQWYWMTDVSTWPGTLISGATSTTYTPPTNAPTSRYYRCRVVGTCSNTAKTSGLITVTDTYTWTGATSTDPTVAGNWNPAAVPCSGANEVIPSGLTNYPAYTNLSINSGTTLTVQSGAKLDISGVLTNNGTLTIESGATLVQGASSTLAGSGTYNVKQAITGAGSTTPTGRFWYLGSPVSLASSSVYFGNAANVVKKRDEATNAWITVASGTPENLVVGKGYYTQAMANSTITFTGGVVNNGATSISGLTRTTGQGFEGFNLVANPYPSYLDWDAVTKTDVGNTMWYRTFNSTNNTMVFDTYVAGTGGIGTNLNGAGVSNLIPPMQSFWVRVNSGSATGSLGLTNSMRAHFTSINGSTAGLKSTSNERDLFLRMNLLQADKKDQLIVYVNETATNGFDVLDGEKMMQAGMPQFYTTAAGKKITINGLNSAKKQQALPITMELPTTGVHSFVIEDLEISNGLVWLEDKQEEIMQALEPGTVYEFYANSGINAERFVLHFQLIDNTTPINVYNEVNGSANFSGKGASVHAESAGVVVIKLPATTEGITDIQIRDAAGRLVYTGSTNTLETSVQLEQANGIYYVTLNGTSGVEVRKVFVQQ